MEFRRLREDEIATFVDDVWLPFAREMADLDEYNELAEDVHRDAVAYRRTQLLDDDAATFVADAEGEIVGYAHVAYAETPVVFARGPEATINEVYVDQDRRGEGLASELLDRAETWADERDCEYVTLSVNADNETARKVYESRGYEVRRLKMDTQL
ncbi:Acetyltransferase (GNAT) family protein [Natronoarchaeum philippinense]|uniref:Acetyltransferase (GNAT) family protein n=1 Tax=Natronoarchaeum philippinense TaxID=558529 RepID=A0A285NW14_NATPI|nr:GNAT family N-acetyltransferase [Natronoarchaeum philippinense]SNZ13123.1 Acetyltransferase (GNAT) family protein [Natronoarchaeum philippinense]